MSLLYLLILFLFSDTPVSVNQETKKSVMDNTNEILILKNKISDLEQKLSLAEVRQSYRRRFNSESQDSKMEQILVNGKDSKYKVNQGLVIEICSRSLWTSVQSKPGFGILVLGTETKVQFRYWYRSRIFFFRNRNFFFFQILLNFSYFLGEYKFL